MKKSTVISSIISAAMIASSSVAAIYASAVNIAPAAAPAPAVQCTTVPAEIYDFICPEPTTAPVFYDYIEPGVEPTTCGVSTSDMSARELFMYFDSDWYNDNPDVIKEVSVEFMPDNTDEMEAACDAAGREYQQSDAFSDIDWQAQDYIYTKDLDTFNRKLSAYKYAIGYGQKLYELKTQALDEFAAANGITDYKFDPYTVYYNDKLIAFECKADANTIYALTGQPGVERALSIYYVDPEDYPEEDPTEPFTESFTPYIDDQIYEQLENDPSGCRVNVYLRELYDENEVDPALHTIAAYGAHKLRGFYYAYEDEEMMFRMMCDLTTTRLTDKICEKYGITPDINEAYSFRCIADRELLDKLAQDPIINDIYLSDPNYDYSVYAADDLDYPTDGTDCGDYDVIPTTPEPATEPCTCDDSYFTTAPVWDDFSYMPTTTEPATQHPTGGDDCYYCMLMHGYITPSAAVIRGDANNDGRVTVSDVVSVLQYIADKEKYPLSDEGLANADIDGTPGITGSDAISIQCIDAGISPASSGTPGDVNLDGLVNMDDYVALSNHIGFASTSVFTDEQERNADVYSDGVLNEKDCDTIYFYVISDRQNPLPVYPAQPAAEAID